MKTQINFNFRFLNKCNLSFRKEIVTAHHFVRSYYMSN